MSQTAALHVEDHDVPLRKLVLGEPDVIEHTEDADGVCEVQLAVVELCKAVDEYVVAFSSRLGEGDHVPGTVELASIKTG